MRVLIVSANREILPSPVVPLGAISVAAAARREHDVRFLDLCFEEDPNAAVRDAIDRFDPEVVGLGIRNVRTNAYAEEDTLLAEYASRVTTIRSATRARIVLGGAGFSLRPDQLIARLQADHGVVGEGERSFLDLLRRIERGGDVPVCLASAATDSSRGAVRTDAVTDLDALDLPARDLIDPRYYAFDGVDNIQTKRGCAFDCAYCDYPDLEGRTVRTRSPERVADEFEARAADPRVNHIFFVDSVFNMPKWHALAVCRALEQRGAPLPWVCYASPAGLDEEIVAAMARARCVGVEIGSDAGHAGTLRRLRKPFGVDAIVRAHELFTSHGIKDCHTFVLGAFEETATEAEETLAFVERLNPAAAVFVVFSEDRESHNLSVAEHRAAILDLLRREAPKHPGWSVPELGIRFGPKLTKFLKRTGVRGPAWMQLTRRDL